MSQQFRTNVSRAIGVLAAAVGVGLINHASADTTVDGNLLYLQADSAEPVRIINGGVVRLNAIPSYSTPFTIERGRIEAVQDILGQTIIAQPITLIGHQRAELASFDRRQNLILEGGVVGEGDLFLFGRITVNGPLDHDGGLTVGGWRVTINGPTSFTGPLQVAPDTRLDLNVNLSTIDVMAAGDIRIAPGKRLTSQSSAITLAGGGINGAIGAAHLRVTDGGYISNLDDYAGTITVHGGTLHADVGAGLGSLDVPITIASPFAAAVNLRASTAKPIDLNNATGYGGGGALTSIQHLDAPVIHTGPLDLGDIGASISGTFTLAGPVSGGDLLVVSPPRLESKSSAITSSVRLAGSANTYTGQTRIESGATLRLAEDGVLATTSALHIAGELRLDPAPDGVNRIAESIPVTLAGGKLTSAAPGAQRIGPVTLDRHTSEIELSDPAASLVIASLTRQPTAIARFRSTGGQLGGPADNDPRIIIASAPALTHGILGGWAIAGSDFAAYGPNGIAPFSGYGGDINAASSAESVSITTPATLAGPRTIHALRFEPGQSLNLNQHALEIGSGGVILQSTTIQDGTLLPGEHADGQLIVHLVGSGNTLSAGTSDTPRGKTTLILSGDGLSTAKATLADTSTHTGGTIIDKSAITVTAPSALPFGGALAASDAQIAVNAGSTPLKLGPVTLRGVSTIQGVTPIDAESWMVERGSILSPLAGSGTIIKTSPGYFSISGDGSLYTGLIDVREGILRARGGGPGGLIRVGERAILQNGTELFTPVELAGGSIMAGIYSGGITVSAPSTFMGGYDESFTEINVTGPFVIGPGGSVNTAASIRVLVGGDLHVDGELSGPFIYLTGPSRRTISGSGVINIGLGVDRDNVLAPGNGVGALTVRGIALYSGGTYRWEIASAQGTPGLDWDVLRITGGLLAQPGDEPFTIQIIPAALAESAGPLPGFDPTLPWAWPIATLVDGARIGPLDLAMFHIDADAFLAHNDLAGGSFSLARTPDSLELRFTPVPEPGAVLSLLLAGLALTRRRGR